MPETKVELLGECVEWGGARNPNGYGRWTAPTGEHSKHRRWYAHRLVWTVLVGPIPEGMNVLHKCDNRPCVNTDHLFLGTQAENMADMITKGRQNKPKGEANGNAKLTEDQVRAIRADARPQRVIAADYGVGKSLVGSIKLHQSWTHVK